MINVFVVRRNEQGGEGKEEWMNDNEKMDDDGRVRGTCRSGSFVFMLVVVAVIVFFLGKGIITIQRN